MTAISNAAADTPWTDVDQLSIDVYDSDDGLTADPNAQTSIYANGAHQAIVVISFVPLNGDQEIPAASLPPESTVRRAITLLDYDTGKPLETTVDGDTWSWGRTRTAFACPLGMSSGEGVVANEATLGPDGLYTLIYYVSAEMTAGDSRPVNIGMQLDTTLLRIPGQDKILITSSASDPNHNECCTIVPIAKDTIPLDLVKKEVIYATAYTDPVTGASIRNNDDVPTSSNPRLTQGDYCRAIHIGHYLDAKNAQDKDFKHNNRIFNIGITTGQGAYIAKQTTPTGDDEDPASNTANLTEPCCFLDQRDGFYSYKGYLWPKFMVGDDDVDEVVNDDENPLAYINNRDTYTLYQDAFNPYPIDLNAIFSNNAHIKYASGDKYLFMSIYLTFGFMVQYFKRQAFFPIHINDQYGNTLDVFVNPGNCPNIMNIDGGDSQNGVAQFCSKNIEWLSPAAGDTPDEIVGSYEDVYFWLAPHSKTSDVSQVLKFDYDGGGEISKVAFRGVADYGSMTCPSGMQYAIRTFRTERQDYAANTWTNFTYKLAMLPLGSKEQNAVIGAVTANRRFFMSPLPIYMDEIAYSTYNWQFAPVWDNGGFVMWAQSGDNYYSMQNATLCVVDASQNPDLYSITIPGAFSTAVFATLPAYRFKPDQTQDKSRLEQAPLDNGSGAADNPYIYNPGNPDRGDWAGVATLQMRWTDAPYVGMALYANGLHQAEITLDFDALRFDPAAPAPAYCRIPPDPQYVANSIQVIDYDTGKTISSGVDGWTYTLVGTPFRNMAPNSAFGETLEYTTPATGANYHYTVKLYIANTSDKAVTTRRLSVRFVINDPNWSCPIVYNFTNGTNGAPATAIEARTVSPPQIGADALTETVIYRGSPAAGLQADDDRPQATDGSPCSYDAYNRLWDIAIRPFTGTGSQVPGRILGWRIAGDTTYHTDPLYRSTAPVIGRRSVGLYHNQFYLFPQGSFIKPDLSDISTCPLSLCPINPIAGPTQAGVREVIDGSLYLSVYASFSGQCCTGYYFPAFNVEWVDEFGNVFPFNIDFNAFGMLYTGDDSAPYNNAPANFIFPGKSTAPIGYDGYNTYVNFYFYTSSLDHTIRLDDWSKGSQTANLIYGSPMSGESITLKTGADFSMQPEQVSLTQCELWFQWYHPDGGDSSDDIGLGRDYSQSSNDPWPGYQAFAGYVQSGRFWYYLLPVWRRGRLSILSASRDYLSIIDEDNPKNNPKIRVLFTGFSDDFSIFNYNIV